MYEKNERYMADIAVFGAGPAGIAAAWQAGMDGTKVCLIEVTDRIGGVMGSCPGMMLGAGYPTGNSIGGFFEAFVQRLYNMSPPVAQRRTCSLENFGDEVVYHHEYAVAILYEMLAEANVEILLNAIPAQVRMEGNKIEAVEVTMIDRTLTVTADMYLDCTGNGEIAHRAGVKSQKGNEDGLMMGTTLTFFMENVDCKKVFQDPQAPYFEEYAKTGIENGELHHSIPQIYMLPAFREKSVFINTVTITGIDGTNSRSVLSGTCTARKRVLQLSEFLKKYIPGFENSWVSCIGPTVGIRETRKLEGLYQVTYDDIYKGTKFEDGIVACDNPLDEVFRDEHTTHYSHEAALKEGYYTIPLRALIPRYTENLLFAGKCMSVDMKAFASVRGMPQCMLMGQAIALAACDAQCEGIPVQEIDGKKVAARMRTMGVWGI